MMTYRFYVAGPLFNAYEQAFQAQLEQALAALGATFLPQRDCPQENPDAIFASCLAGIDQSEIIVANLSGVDVDSGTAFEVGYAYAKGKPIYGIRSELIIGLPDRTLYPNLMLRDSVQLYASIEGVITALQMADSEQSP